MKIRQARIFNYGKWHNVTVSFRTGLNILYGRNEAGKTTLLSFIKGVLFGYLSSRSSHKNYIPRNSKNYGGQLEIVANSRTYIIQRMAGKNGGVLTVLDRGGHRLNNEVLSKILGPFDRDTFNALYYFGDVNLKAMGKLKRNDLIYRIQRIGLSHSDEWIAYREGLTKQAKQLYSPRGYKPPLNQALKRYSALVSQAKAAHANYDVYRNYQSQIHHLRTNQQLINQKLKDTNQKIDRLERDQNAWVRYQKMVQLRPMMKQSVRKGFTQHDAGHLRDLKDRINTLDGKLKLTKQQINELDQQMVNDDNVDNYQRHHATIEKLSDRFNEIQRKMHDDSLLKGRYSDLRKQLDQLRSRYTVSRQVLQPMNVDDLRTSKTEKRQIAQIQDQLQNLSQELVQYRGRAHFGFKEVMISGLSGLMIVAGVVIKQWLLAGLGAVILALGLWLSMYRNRQQQIQRVQIKIDHQQRTVKHLRMNVGELQHKYHYPDLSVEVWLANQSNLRRVQKLTTDVKLMNQKIHQMARSIQKYFAQWDFMNRELTLSSDNDTKLLQLKNYVNRMTRVINTNRQANFKKQTFAKKLDNLTQQEKSSQDKLKIFYRNRQIWNDDEFIKVQDQQIKLSRQQATYHDLSKQIGSSEIKALKRYQTLDDLKQALDNVDQRLMTLKSEDQGTTDQLTTVQVKLRQMVRDGSYDELQQRIANYRTEISGLAERWLEKSLASQWINATLNLATKGRVPKIEAQAQRNFRILTDRRYPTIVFNKSRIKVMRKDKKRFTLYELSKGTVQQLYLALVFAMSQVFSTDYPMPVLIDDGFTDFDVTRKRAAVKLLKSISQKLQVIYCTSDDKLSNQPPSINLSQIK